MCCKASVGGDISTHFSKLNSLVDELVTNFYGRKWKEFALSVHLGFAEIVSLIFSFISAIPSF